MLSKGFAFLILLGIFMPSVAQASICSATWAVWLDWYRCVGCGHGDGFTFTKTYTPGFPDDLGSVDGWEWEQEEAGWTYSVAYMSASPQKIVPNPWPGESGERIYSYLVYKTNVSFSKGSAPSYPPFEIHNYKNDVFLGWGLENIWCSDDDDDDDDCCGLACMAYMGLNLEEFSWLIPYLPNCDEDEEDDDDEEECPDLNLTIRGTLLPIRRGTARISGDWCKSLSCGTGILK